MFRPELANIHLFDIVVLDCIPPAFIAHTTGMTHFLDRKQCDRMILYAYVYIKERRL